MLIIILIQEVVLIQKVIDNQNGIGRNINDGMNYWLKTQNIFKTFNVKFFKIATTGIFGLSKHTCHERQYCIPPQIGNIGSASLYNPHRY